MRAGALDTRASHRGVSDNYWIAGEPGSLLQGLLVRTPSITVPSGIRPCHRKPATQVVPAVGRLLARVSCGVCHGSVERCCPRIRSPTPRRRNTRACHLPVPSASPTVNVETR